MKLFTAKQITEIDHYTIHNEPIKSIHLMERAAKNICNYLIFEKKIVPTSSIYIVCGHGNNGGDGLALARILHKKHFNNIKVLLFAPDEKKLSSDCLKNWKRLQKLQSKKHKNKIEFKLSFNPDDFDYQGEDVIIDALFGSGLSRPLGETYKTLIKKINATGAPVYSIDIPSGLLPEDNRNNDSDAIIKATEVITIEFPKLAFFFPENAEYVKDFKIVSINLHPEIKANLFSPYYYIETHELEPKLKIRNKFAEKHDFGHALLIAGSYEKCGAAILASEACLRTGVGLLHTHLPKKCIAPFQSRLPEAMVSVDKHKKHFSQVPELKHYTAVGIGPGIGTSSVTKEAFFQLIEEVRRIKLPLIIDADGLNILAEQKEVINQLPFNTILTPHRREFDRLFGEHCSHYDRFLTAQKIAKEAGIIIVLKGAYTQIHTSKGQVFFNSTGGPEMAKGGSGDVLTGMILAFLAQHYTPEDAALLGVHYHGIAGTSTCLNERSVLASDIICSISNAFK